jgi:hypothetical protein
VQPPRGIDIRGVNSLQLAFRADTREIGGKDFETPLAGQIERLPKVSDRGLGAAVGHARLSSSVVYLPWRDQAARVRLAGEGFVQQPAGGYGISLRQPQFSQI